MNAFSGPPVAFARFPALRIALLFGSGILLSARHPLDPGWWTGAFLLFLAFYGTAEWLCSSRLDRSRHILALFLYAVVVFLAGGARHALEVRSLEHSHPMKLLPIAEGDRVVAEGELLEIRRSASGRYLLDLEVSRTRLADSMMIQGFWRMRTGADAATLPAEGLRRGSRIVVQATLFLPEGKRNPHGFDYREYLYRQKIWMVGNADSILAVLPPEKISWNDLRQRALDLIKDNFSSDTAPLAAALLLGFRHELDREVRRNFSRAGLSHIMAVSGLHVGFILAPFWLVIPFFWSFRPGRWIGFILLAALLVGYAGLTGFSPSVIRASITGGCLIYGRLFHRVRNSLNLTAVAALLILAWNPRQLFDIGFQLSFSAVFIILLCLPVLHRTVPEQIRYRWSGRLLMVFLVSAAVQFGMFPLLAHYFGEFSLAGPLLNGLALPLLSLLIPSALLLLVFSLFYPLQGAWLNGLNDLALRQLSRAVSEVSTWEWSWVAVPSTDPLLFPVWICLIFLAAFLRSPSQRWKWVVILLLLCCWYAADRIGQKTVPGRLTVTFFDVGQADAALVRTPGGRNLLIDTGRWNPGYSSGSATIVPHLRATGTDTIDAVFLTHPHADHIGGLPALLEQIPVRMIYHSGYPYDSGLHHTWRRMAEEQNIPHRALRAGESVALDPAIRLLVYAPLPGPLPSNPNEHSLVLELIYGSTEFLFMGDAGRATERKLIPAWGPLLRTGILKAGHHGSRTASSSAFLRWTGPRAAVVSVAADSRFGHPDPETVGRLRRYVPGLYFTSLEGALVWRSDGTTVTRHHW